MRLVSALTILIAAISASGCANQKARGELVLSPCPVEGADEAALCGRLKVPENWSVRGGRALSLNVVVIPAKSSSGAAPLFDLAGGPGLAATDAAPFYLTFGGRHRENRDIVLVDQRGTGESAPLRCPQIEKASPLTPLYPPDIVRACYERLSREHDLSQFSTLATALDLDAVRQAIGADAIDIFALSYGTKLAQAYMREFPDKVRAAVLMGAAPMDLRAPLHHAPAGERALRLIFADCAQDEKCAASYPNLESEWDAVLERFDKGPVTMSTPDGELVVARGPFTEALRGLLATERGGRLVPNLIHAAARGDFAPFVTAAASGPRGLYAEGLYLSIECAESAPLIRKEEIAALTEDTFLGRYRIDAQLSACDAWPVAPAPSAFSQPIESDAPVLLFAGGRDYVTPLEFAIRIAAGLPNSRIIEIEDMAHVPDGISPIECLDDIMLEFYERADVNAVDAACAGRLQPPPFVVPEQ